MGLLMFSSDPWDNESDLSDMPDQDRYVISVKVGRELDPADLVGAVQRIPGADVIEGSGTSTLTVNMTEKAFLLAQKQFDDCVIQRDGLLDLL